MLGQPHQQRPDIDNLAKGVMDALASEDSYIYELHATKVWGEEGKIEIWNT
jgi:Holliday junction resolvase RusA-like endonuclease